MSHPMLTLGNKDVKAESQPNSYRVLRTGAGKRRKSKQRSLTQEVDTGDSDGWLRCGAKWIANVPATSAASGNWQPPHSTDETAPNVSETGKESVASSHSSPFSIARLRAIKGYSKRTVGGFLRLRFFWALRHCLGNGCTEALIRPMPSYRRIATVLPNKAKPAKYRCTRIRIVSTPYYSARGTSHMA